MSSRLLKIALPVSVLVLGALAAYLLASSRTAPERTERLVAGPLVEVVSVNPADVEVAVAGHGEVVPQVAVNLVPQVSGRVVSVHPSLVAGGFFAAGDPLLLIDPRDYELAVDRAQATVARARVSLERERAEAEVARQEWDALHPGEEPPSGLVVREPQIRQAEAELEAAVADLEAARLNLERTRVTVPFDGVVVSKQVDVGQYVGVGAVVGTVYGTDVVEVRVPLESRELAWFNVPSGTDRRAAQATVTAEFAGARHMWPGRVTRIEATVDPSSRMVNVVVEVPRPYAADGGRPPLLPGTFAHVTISGRTVENVFELPRHAVHDGATVWVVEDDRLRIRSVELIRSDRALALVASGLEPGARVVVSALDAVTDGMAVRPTAAGDAAPAGGQA